MQQTNKKKYKTGHDWMGKMINQELSKKLRFDHINKWYMLKQESVRENETHKILWNFEILNGSPNPSQKNRSSVN